MEIGMEFHVAGQL